eukprot:sb/3474928/
MRGRWWLAPQNMMSRIQWIIMPNLSCHRSLSNIWTFCRPTLKSDFLKLLPPWVARKFLFARRNLVLAVTSLFLSRFGQTKVLRTPKIMLFPVIYIRIFAEKLEQVGAVTRKYDAARRKGVTSGSPKSEYWM